MVDKSYEFVSVEKISSVYDIHEILNNPSKICRFFLDNDDEVLYVTSEGCAYGLISIGDMIRYYREQYEEVPINKNFSYVKEENDYLGAENFFKNRKYINEIPVVKGELFLGVIRNSCRFPNEKSREELKCQLMFAERALDYQVETIQQFAKLGYKFLINKRNVSNVSKDVLGALTKEDKMVLENRYKLIRSISPEMLVKMTKTEQVDYLKKNLSRKGNMEKFIQPFLDWKELKLSVKNGISCYEDCHNDTFYISGGIRNNPNAPEHAKRKIWMLGFCTVFGNWVNDAETIQYYMQKQLNASGFYNYEIVNYAGMISADLRAFLLTESISLDDIIVIYDRCLEDNTMFSDSENIHCIWDFTDIYLKNINTLTEHVFESIHHCDGFINKQIAAKMYEGIIPFLSRDDTNVRPRRTLQDYYITPQIYIYYERYANRYHLSRESGMRTGAIVMNCNPFTFGHRYLIEQACAQVDKLYVFVVEENKSYFSFVDRFDMVKRGTADIKKVQVLPSGKYIISKDTFAEYFIKDQIVEEPDDMDYDVRIFGEVVADILGISCRFVGEEPFDQVTRKYNETMKRILPEYHVDVVEIPRKELEGNVISASMVRKYMEEGALDRVHELVPESTVDVCRSYMRSKN